MDDKKGATVIKRVAMVTSSSRVIMAEDQVETHENKAAIQTHNIPTPLPV